VDNPHTKPFAFWSWLLAEVKARHPGVFFLAEAFTRPKLMKQLSKLGFSQSYTYFTWRTGKRELAEYLTELTRSGMEDYFRPNFFVNTHDVLPYHLQAGGPAAFRLRALLAATLVPAWGMYSGFELCEAEALPGTEEYARSEKFEIKVRDWDRPGNIKELVARLNRIRRSSPALARLGGLSFLETDSDALLAYVRSSRDGADRLLVVVNLDPGAVASGVVTVPPEAVGSRPGQAFAAHDLLTGQTWRWGERNWVRLDPGAQPGHVLEVALLEEGPEAEPEPEPEPDLQAPALTPR
jgi:starch synthase (maltosyl-transferring)